MPIRKISEVRQAIRTLDDYPFHTPNQWLRTDTIPFEQALRYNVLQLKWVLGECAGARYCRNHKLAYEGEACPVCMELRAKR